MRLIKLYLLYRYRLIHMTILNFDSMNRTVTADQVWPGKMFLNMFLIILKNREIYSLVPVLVPSSCSRRISVTKCAFSFHDGVLSTLQTNLDKVKITGDRKNKKIRVKSIILLFAIKILIVASSISA